MEDKPDNARPGLVTSAKRLLYTLAAIARNRIELLMVELQEERLRFLDLLLLAAAVVVFGLMTLVMLTFAVLLLASEENRLAVTVVITGVYLLAMLLAFWRLRARLKEWSAFSATRAELQKDLAWLEDKNSTS